DRRALDAVVVEVPGRVRLGVDQLVGGGSCRGDFDVVLEVELAIAILVVRRGGMSGHRCVVLPKNIRRYRGSVYYPASPVIRRVRAITDVDPCNGFVIPSSAVICDWYGDFRMVDAR